MSCPADAFAKFDPSQLCPKYNIPEATPYYDRTGPYYRHQITELYPRYENTDLLMRDENIALNPTYDRGDPYYSAEPFPRYDGTEPYPRHDSAESYPRYDSTEGLPQNHSADISPRHHSAKTHLNHESVEKFSRFKAPGLSLRHSYPEAHSGYGQIENQTRFETVYSDNYAHAIRQNDLLAYPQYPVTTNEVENHMVIPYPQLFDQDPTIRPRSIAISTQDGYQYHPVRYTPSALHLWTKPANTEDSPRDEPMQSHKSHNHTCTVCGRHIQRDLSRHMRTHMPCPRFSCPFPLRQCRHRSRKFNRPYDFKKHLLNRHFDFDDPTVKRLHNLGEKLPHPGTCGCGARFNGGDWLERHICTSDPQKLCVLVSISTPTKPKQLVSF